MHKVVAVLLAFLLFALPATALREEVNLYPSQGTLSACACEIREQSLLVQNTGDAPSTYQLFKSGSAAEWLTISDGGFSLEPGQSRAVRQFLQIPCAAQGTYDLSTSVQTQFGMVEQSTQLLSVQQCADLNLVPLNSNAQQSCPCTPVAFTFQVENNGNAAESYRAKVEPATSVTITESAFMLMPGERHSITAYVHAPCAEFGHREYRLIVEAERSQLEGSYPFSLDINACYDYGIGVQSAYPICQNLLNTIPITVTNAAAFRNSYQLSLHGVPWGNIEDSSMVLESQQTGNTRMLLDPRTATPGTYTVTVDAVSERGELMQSRPIAVTLEACYDVALIPERVDPTLVTCEPMSYAVLVQNAGTQHAAVSLALEGPQFTALDRPQLALQPTEAQIVRVQGTTPCDAQNFAATLTAAFAKVPELGTSLPINFAVVPLAEAYALDIQVEDVRIGYGEQQTIITLTNTGIRDGTYRVGIAGPEFATLNAEQIAIPAGQSVELVLTTFPSAETPEDAYPLTIAAGLTNPYAQGVVYQRDISITLRERSTVSTILPYALGLLLLCLIGIAVSMRGKRRSEIIERKPLVRESKLGKRKSLIRELKVPVAARIVEKFKQPKERHVELRIKPWMWKTFIALCVILLVGLATFFTSPLLRGFAPAAEQPTSVVRIGDTNLRVLPGNIVLVTRPSELPLIVENREQAATYDITIDAPEWVTAQSKIALAPGQEREVTLTLDPTGQAPGDYAVAFAIATRGTEEEQSETLTLRIFRLMGWQKVLFAIAIAMLVLAALLTLWYHRLLALVQGIRKRTKQLFTRAPQRALPATLPKITAEKIAAEKIALFRFHRILPVFIPTKGLLRRTRERLAKINWRPVLLALIPLAIIAAAVLVAFYTPLFQRTAEVAQESYADMAERIKAVKPAVIDLTGERLPDTIYLDEDGVLIPLKIRNDDRFATYLINVQEDVDWISTDKTVLDIKPQSFGTVNIAVAPTAAVKEGTYRITVGVTLEGGEELFDKGVVLDYRKKLWKKLVLWAILVALGVALTTLLIRMLRRREAERMHRKGAEVKL